MSDAWAELAHAAMPLAERIALAKTSIGVSRAASIETPNADHAALRAFWSQTLGGDEALRRRLAWDGLDEKALQLIFSPPRSPSDTSPDWIRLLQEVHATSARGDHLENPELAEVPFADFWAAFGAVALDRLRAHPTFGKSSTIGLSSEAWTNLGVFLAKRLAPTGARTLFADFAAFRQKHDPAGSDAETFPRWMAQWRSDGAMRLWQQFPVLARHLAILTLDAIHALILWWDRLTTDWPELCQTFDITENETEITKLRLGLSDRHYGGQQALLLVISTRVQLIYKPKSVDVDAAFSSWLRTLGQTDDGSLTKALPPALRLLAKPGHGWAEFVPQAEFSSEDEVAIYYRRCGGLLALAYALEGRDFTMDNVVAAREGPAAIDAETLLQPLCQPLGAESLNEQALKALTERLLRERDFSVLDTGLLPAWQAGVTPSAGFFDVSGIGGQTGYSAGVQAERWVAMNTSQMRLENRPVDVPAEHNGVHLNGKPCSAREQLSEILSGFETLYRGLLKQRDESKGALAAALQPWASSEVRLLLRATGIYGRTLHRMLAPENLTHPLLQDFLSESLWKPFLRCDAVPAIAPLLKEEASALSRLDIPCFHLTAHGNTRPFFLASPLQMAFQRLRSLSESDLAAQRRIIRASFTLSPRRQAAAFDPQIAFDEAERIAEILQWPDAQDIAPSAAPHASLAGSAPNVAQGETANDASKFLYGGRLGGEALFWAALFKASGAAAHRDRALDHLEKLWNSTGGNAHWCESAATLPVGAASGLASVIYTFHVAGRLVRSSECQHRGREMVRLITHEAVNRDLQYDVLGGAAGAGLVLSLLGSEGDPDGSLRARVLWCGEHLLAHAESLPDQPGLWWRGEIGEYFLGYGHGASGIGAALARMARFTGDDRFAVAAHQVFEALEALYSSSEKRWPVLLRGRDPVFHRVMESLCHGSAGIALAAAEARACGIATHQIPERALAVMREAPLHEVDTLCCGNIGRMEAALSLTKEGGAEWAPELAAQCLGRRELCGIFRTSPKRSEQWTLPGSFFRGLPGIGYTLLRTMAPGEVPSVALWR